MKAGLEPSRAARERELFLGALELPAERERAAFLEAGCGDDQPLRERVAELLREQEAVGGFLETPALAAGTTVSGGPPDPAAGAGVAEKSGDRIGRYKLLQQIGEGGCGVVYMAEQETPVRRRVALKVIKLGMDTKNVIARFEAERQALAMMDHAHIARVLDAGATETGRPYFVMELVRGIRITEYCDQNKLPTETRLRLFIQVCHAVQHAHQKGIIHRDLKPSNILVTLNDGRPTPKVIDFGIAKATEQRLTEKTLFTAFQAFIGTPAYMSPEQAQMTELDVDTRSDIYSLGVLLYELLTGSTPFDAETLLRAGLDECRRTIREVEPPRPSTRLGTMGAAALTTTASQRCTDTAHLVHLLRGDLDWIAMRCLEKDRTRRYATANALALDLQRYLDNEPVLARPPSQYYRFRKMLRRHRLVVGAAAGITLALLGGVALSTWQAVRATRAEDQARDGQKREFLLRRQAELENAAARLNEYIADMALAQQSITAGNYGRAVQLVEKHRPKAAEPDLRGFEWRYLWQLAKGNEHVALPTQPGNVLAVAISPDGRWAAVGLREQLKVFDLASRAAVATLPRGAVSLAFLPDGKTLVSASRAAVRLWRTADWTEIRTLPDASGPLALSGDGRFLATAGPGGARVWDAATGSELHSLPGAMPPLAFAPVGDLLATDSRQGITLWPLREGRPALVLPDSTNLFLRAGPMFTPDRGLAFSADGKVLVAPRNTASARGVFVLGLWDTESGRELATLPADPEHPEHVGVIASLVASPDGRTLATASFDHSVRFWNLPNRRFLGALQGHLNEVWAVGFSPDGQHLLSGAKDGGLNLWPLRPQSKEELLPEGWAPLAFSRDSRELAALDARGTLALFSLVTHEAERQFQLEVRSPMSEGRPPGPGPGQAPAFPPPEAGGRVGAGARPEAERARPPPGEGSRPPFDPARFLPGGRPPEFGMRGPPGFWFMPPVALSADLRLLAVARRDHSIQLWDTEAQQATALALHDCRPDFLALSPDGKTLLVGGRDQPLQWWEPAKSTNALLTLEGARPMFSAEGNLLTVFGHSNAVQVWDVRARALRGSFLLEPPPGFAAALSADGRLLATTAGFENLDNAIYLWSTGAGKLVGTCAGHKQPVVALAFAPDGRTLATASADSTVKFWNLTTQQELLSIRHLGTVLDSLLFSPDGELLVGRGGPFAGAAKLWVHRAPPLSVTDAASRRAPPATRATR